MILQCVCDIWIEYILQKIQKNDKKWATLACKVPQTFDHLIIDLHQPFDNVQLNMHNIYVILWCLWSIDGLIILWYINIQHIHKANFKKGSLKWWHLFQNIIIITTNKTLPIEILQ